MTAFANLTINDSVPAAHTFGTVDKDAQGVAKYADRAGGIAIGFARISLQVKEPTKDSRHYKLTARVTVPTLEVSAPSTATGYQPAPKVAYNTTFEMSASIHERSSLLERKNAFAYFKNLMAQSIMTNAVENFEPVI